MKKILLIITLTLLSCCTYASDWSRYNSIFVDDSSVEKTKTSVRAWIISPNFEKSKINARKYTYQAYYIDAKCSEHEIATFRTAWYNKYHQWEESAIDDPSYIKIKPKTHNEVIFKSLCIQEKIL